MSPLEPIELQPIGVVRTSERDVRRVDWSGVQSTIELRSELAEGLLGLEDYSHVIVVGWLHLVPEELRSRLQAYPSGDERLPVQGAFALRGARPNPLAVAVCRLHSIESASVHVEGLDLVDGTPVLDLKPYIAFYDAAPEATLPRWAEG